MTDEEHGALRRLSDVEDGNGTEDDVRGIGRVPGLRPQSIGSKTPWYRGRVLLLGGLLGVVAVVVGGALAAHEFAAKLFDVRYRLQLLEARQESLGQIEAIAVEREQAARGAAHFTAPRQPSPFLRGAWEKIGGSNLVPGWPDGYTKTKALAVHEDRLYVGLARPNQGPPQVWRFDGAVWDQIGSAETVPDWSRHSYVSALVSDGATLYAGIGDTVWAFDSRRGWRQIGGDARAGSWRAGIYSNAYSLAVYRGRLIVGMTGGRQAAVYAYAAGTWEKIAGEGIGAAWSEDRYTGVYEVWTHSDGFLYAGLIANPGPTAVYRFDGARWEKVGGDGVNGSWSSPGFSYVFSFASLDGRLVASMNRHPMVAGNFSSVWSFDGKVWQPVGLGHIPALWGHMHNYNALAAYEGRLVIGAGGHPAGNASVWEIDDGMRPVMVGGRGVKGSWDGGELALLAWLRFGNMEHVYRFVIWRGDLVAGFADEPGSADVWRYRPNRAARGTGTVQH